MATSKYDVVGVGAAIVDRILHVSDEFLATVPGRKGGMEPIDKQQFDEILKRYGREPISAPGGSAANVLRGLSRLGLNCALISKIGHDPLADVFLRDLKAQNITPLFTHGKADTAQVLSLVTPDGQRTCRTYLGAAIEMHAHDLHAEDFQHTRLVHIEGYGLSYGDLVPQAMRLAKAAGAKISLDLASFEMVAHYRHLILDLLKNYVDIVFANDLEAKMLMDTDAKEACAAMAKLCPTAVVSLNKEGCWVAQRHELQHCPAYPVDAIDTTGAGDLFASGFLYGYLANKPLSTCAHYGALLGAAVVQVEGAEIPEERWKQLQQDMQAKDEV